MKVLKFGRIVGRFRTRSATGAQDRRRQQRPDRRGRFGAGRHHRPSAGHGGRSRGRKARLHRLAGRNRGPPPHDDRRNGWASEQGSRRDPPADGRTARRTGQYLARRLPDPRPLSPHGDAIVSYGERLSSGIVAAVLEGSAGSTTRGSSSARRPTSESTSPNRI